MNRASAVLLIMVGASCARDLTTGTETNAITGSGGAVTIGPDAGRGSGSDTTIDAATGTEGGSGGGLDGCTNPDASNYDPGASSDDGSCLIAGCTDINASNFDPEATFDDGSCVYDCNLGSAGACGPQLPTMDPNNPVAALIVKDTGNPPTIIFDKGYPVCTTPKKAPATLADGSPYPYAATSNIDATFTVQCPNGPPKIYQVNYSGVDGARNVIQKCQQQLQQGVGVLVCSSPRLVNQKKGNDIKQNAAVVEVYGECTGQLRTSLFWGQIETNTCPAGPP